MDEDKTLGLDRRRYPRLEDSVFILGNLRSNPTEKFMASTQNISAGGLMFETERDISQDTALGFEIYQPIDRHNNMSFSIVVLAMVTWIREIEKNNFEEGGNKYRIGVEFLEIKEEDRNRIVEYVEEGRKTGVDLIRNTPWGTHLCQFYKTKEDLMDILVPYFKTGLENNEFCLWVTSEPVSEEEATNAMRKVVPDFDRYLKNRHMEIFPHSEWYLKDGVFNSQRVLNTWIDKLNQAHSKGFNGMRVTGNTAWLEKRDWKDFTNYEEEINKAIGKYRMLVICSYSLNKYGVSEVVDIISNHQFALIKREDKWEFIESPERKKAKEELMASEKKFKDLIETTPDWVWETDRDGVYTYISPRVKDLLGYEVNEVLGKTPFDLMPKEEAQRIGKIFKEKVIKKEPFYNLENINRHKNGHFVVLETNGIPIFGKEGQLKGYRGIDRDITERKKIEEALRKTKENYRELTNSIADVFFAMDKDLRYTYWNKASENLTGISAKDALGKSLYKLFPGIRGTETEKLYLKTLKTQQPQSVLNEYRVKDKNFFFEISAYPSNDGLSVFVKDITELKQAEETLTRERDNLNSIFGAMNDGVYIVDQQYDIQHVNRVLQEEYGSWKGIKCYAYFHDRTEICPWCPNQKVFAGETVRWEWYSEKNGKTYDLIDTPLKGPDGSILKLEIFRDVTERKQAEKMLRASGLRLRDQNLALEQKNLALKEIIEHIERTKNKTKEDVAINVDETLMPIVEKLKIKGVSPKYIKLLKHHLKSLSSSFGRKIIQKSAKLTSREIEICNMIKGGLTSKDISGLLNLSRQTIEKHRKNIRKKLGLSNKKANLSSYLQNF